MRLRGCHSLWQHGSQLLQLGPPAEVHVRHVIVVIQQALQLLCAQAQGLNFGLQACWQAQVALSPMPGSSKDTLAG